GDEYADGARQRGQPIKGMPETDTVLYDFDLAERVKLCAPQPSNSLEEARTAYNLPRSGPARVVERTVCWRIPIEGPITGETVEQVKRRIRRALRAHVNVLIFELKCAGGDADKAYDLGMYLAGLNDDRSDNPVDTIAYVTTKARNLAVFPA